MHGCVNLKIWQTSSTFSFISDLSTLTIMIWFFQFFNIFNVCIFIFFWVIKILGNRLLINKIKYWEVDWLVYASFYWFYTPCSVCWLWNGYYLFYSLYDWVLTIINFVCHTDWDGIFIWAPSEVRQILGTLGRHDMMRSFFFLSSVDILFRLSTARMSLCWEFWGTSKG